MRKILVHGCLKVLVRSACMAGWRMEIASRIEDAFLCRFDIAEVNRPNRFHFVQE